MYRVFSRGTSLYKAPLFELSVNKDSAADFVQFPSHMYNVAIFRDERTLNFTAIDVPKIKINATDSKAVSLLKDVPFKITIKVKSKY